MGKYDDAIGGFKVTIDVDEVLNEESAKKVDEKIKAQKAELEKPIEINATTDKAVKKINQLTQALKQVKVDLSDAISTKKSFGDVNKLVTKYESLKRQISSASREVDKNNSALKESNEIIKETQKIIDGISVSKKKFTESTKVVTSDPTKKVTADVKEQKKVIEQTTVAHEEQTAAIQQQRKETEKLAAAQEKLNKTQKKLSDSKLSKNDIDIIAKSFSKKSYDNLLTSDVVDPLERLSLQVSESSFKRLRPKVKAIMQNAVSQIGLDDFDEILRHYFNKEILATPETLLFTLFQDYLDNSIGTNQLNLDKLLEGRGIETALRDEFVKTLNGLSFNYSKLINFSDTFGLGNINLTLPKIEAATQQQEQLTSSVEETIKAREQEAAVTVRTLEQVSAELEQEKQKLQEINSEIERNDNAFQDFYKKQKNYGKVALGTDTAVYDTEILSLASKELKEFNDLLSTRNKFQEKYIKLRDIISRYYVGERVDDYTIDRGIYKDMDQYISQNSNMKRLNSFFQQGQKTTNKEINELFRNVVRELQSEGATVGRLLSSGEVYGAQIWRELDAEETELNQTNQRLLAERETQLSRINALRQEELDLIKQQGQEERRNTEQLKFSDGTVLSEKEVSAVKKYCEVLKNSMGEAYDEALNLKAALDLVFNIKTGNIEALIDRFNASNKASNAALKIMTGMPINNQANRNLALRSTNPSVYDQIKADAEKAKAELANQKTDFQIKWEEFVSVMLGGDAFKDESNLVKGKILKEFSSYADTASDAIDKLNKAWLSGDLEGKSGKTKFIQAYIDHLNDQKEYFDSIRNAKAGDMDVDSLFGLNGTTGLTEEKAKALRDEAAAWDQLIEQKKKYYGIESVESPTEAGIAESAERAADAEERHAAAAGETRKQLEGQKDVEDEITGFTEAQVVNEIKRIREAIHSKEAGLDQVANTEGLQAALAALNERIGSNSPFKLISAQIDSMGEHVDQATLRFQNLDGSISLVQKWAMDDGELTLGRISASQSFKDQEKFDAELYQANAKAKVDKLWSSLSGVEDVSQKVKNAFAAIRTEASLIDSKDALGKFKVSFDTLNNMVQEFKNNYKSLNSISDTVRVAQSKMANAETVLGAKETSISKYVDTNGYEEAARIIGEMRTQLNNYKNAEQNLAEGEDPVQKRVAAYKEYIKLEKELDAQTKKLQSESQFDSFSKVMRDAQTEIDTAILKLQKFAEVEGFDKANQEITNMTNAMNQFNSENSSIEEKAQAVKDYEAAQRSLAKQMQYLNEVQKNNSAVNTEQGKQIQEQEQQIKQYYQFILDTVNKINSLDIEISGLKGKNGNGFYTGLIDQLQADKSKLINEVRTTLQTVNDEFGSGLVGSQNVSLSGARFFSEEDTQNLNRFMQSAQVQSALASGDVNKFTECVNQLSTAFTNSEKIGIEAATKIQEGFSKAQEAASKIFNIDPNAGIIGSKGNINESSDSYQQAKNAYEMLKLARAKIGDKSEADWSGGEAVVIETLTKAFLEYANTLDTVAQKEQKYFAGKSKYTDGQDMNAMVVRAQEATNGLKEIQDVMSKTAKSFAGDNGAVITKFTQSADGISKLDFSVFDKGTNSLRNFSLEMGSVTEGMYITETTVKNTMSAFNAAEKQMQSAGSLLNQMKESGLEGSSGFERIKNAVEKLSSALSSGASDTTLTKLTKEAKLTTSEVDKLYKKWLQMQDAIKSKNAYDLGKIDLNGDVYKQLANSLKQWVDTAGYSNVKITSLNTSTGKFKVTAEGADNTVRTFTGDLSRLNGVATMQQTGIQDLGTKWERFKASLASTGKQFATALVGVNVFYKAIAQIRQGYQYVKEIDLAMTELKKVTDETEASYDNFLKTASKTAGTIGSTVSDFTEATANFARLGYSMEESSKMAETAIVYKNVADGLDTVEESTESIISTMKAYGIEANDTMGIIDKFNEVGEYIAQII